MKTVLRGGRSFVGDNGWISRRLGVGETEVLVYVQEGDARAILTATAALQAIGDRIELLVAENKGKVERVGTFLVVPPELKPRARATKSRPKKATHGRRP